MSIQIDGQGTREIWGRFVSNRETAEDIRALDPVVYHSWVRSRDSHVDPWQAKAKMQKGQELAQRLAENRFFISVARSYMANLSSFLEGEQFSVVIADADGIILEDVGGTSESMIQNKMQTHMAVGANRNEAYVGTNATGTCILLDEPIQICGAEHYLQAHHIFTCSAAPIHDQAGGVIGCLSLVGPPEAHDKHTLGMVVAAADGIEKEFKLRGAYNQLSSTLDSIASGVVMIDNRGVIIQHNDRACKILEQEAQSLAGQKLSSLIRAETADRELHLIESNFYSREMVATLANGNTVSLSLTACVIEDTGGIRAGTVLTFDFTKHVNRIVSQRSGFTARYTFDSIIGSSPQISSARMMGHIAAKRNSTVLILGESGTGKELFAQAIHSGSKRASGPFIAINCGSLPKDLIESELFGYVGGAFTGASKEGQPGKFELADRGTLFLDEIGDMPLASQASLLRVLQLKEITRIGGKKNIPVDVRIVAATNRNLEAKIRDNTFRSDLYYRLNVFPINLPPLRDRRDDVRPFVEHFLKTHNTEGIQVDSISEEALQALEQYSWPGPGNVRELQNVLERAVNIAQTPRITLAELPAEIVSKVEGLEMAGEEFSTPAISDAPAADPLPIQGSIRHIRDTEKDMILLALNKTAGNVSRASQLLGIGRKTLYHKINSYGIDISTFRSGF